MTASPARPRRARAIGLAAVLAAAVLLPRLPAQAQPAQPSPPAVPVTTAAVIRQDVPVLLRNIGTVQAFQAALIRARVDGTLERVFFNEGQEVKKGDPLALIDPRPYAAALAQAQAKKAYDEVQLANAKRDLARYQSLVRNDFASRQQVDNQTAQVGQISATLQGDEAAIAAARLNLEYCHITAPFDGRVGLRLVDPGNMVRATDTTGLVSLTQIHPIAVTFTLPQADLPRIQTAMKTGPLPVLAFAPDDSTELGTGELLTADNAIDQATGTIRLKAVFQNPDSRLWPGQFVNVRLQIGLRTAALTVPSIAVQRGASGLYVFVVKPDSTVAVQRVEIGQDDGRIAVVSRGLDADTHVVVGGMSRLQDGTRVAETRSPAS
ncbi:multidrug efflux pump membrane fusion protein MdtA [Rhodovastum atsumiense]|uniref:Efflux RND transporter periplasmic adaptor subunit n=1 Tax=Rhodovastum atsumiense TaxID=504468 RepID=A0A5M6IS51_9PROT|nr:efflux RND transporter periplasmic adaptor subunit [Rhodovastum atsumiense]KAA5611021.1 efflux RND transporter periplasmic adaptor subunit [Rhodovastum atsumiense]CAH2600195.1 multidrug efflux pump membrane fusion protein MdtA [Rhodovastum atsumiense]